MSKEDMIEMDGVVIKDLSNSMYLVELENKHQITAYLAGKMRKFRIRILPGDEVKIEMSPYDLSKGRIIYRGKKPS